MINKSVINKYVTNREARDQKIWKRLEDDYEYLSETYDVLGVFLFGSQNYETDLPGSDIDVKAIVLPAVDTLLLTDGKINETHERDNGELTVFDVKHMMDYVKKVNVNFLEILFTDYKIINDKYETFWDSIITLREAIAYHNKRAAMECLYGCAMNKLDKVFKRVISNEDKIDKVGYDYKAWADVIRFRYMMTRYANDHAPYEEILIPYKPFESAIYDKIMAIKSCDYICSENEIKEDVMNMRMNLEFYMDQYREKRSAEYDHNVIRYIDEITLNILKAYLNERCYKERWPVLSY